MKACYSCEKKPIKDGIYKAHIEKFIFSKIPKDNKHFHKVGSPSKIISGLKPDTCIFYFGTKERLFTSPLKKFEDAYGNLVNSGCTKTDSKGNAKIFLNCPQLYISLDGKVYNRHLHFIYWDEKNKIWSKTLFTQPLTCNVDKEFVEKHRRNTLLIDASNNQASSRSSLCDISSSNTCSIITLSFSRIIVSNIAIILSLVIISFLKLIIPQRKDAY